MIEQDVCEHRNNRPCYRVHSNNSKHYGYQCVRCGAFRTIKKDDWRRIHIEEKCGPYEPSIADDWRQQQLVKYRESSEATRKENRETVLAAYYDSSEWDRKRRARFRLNQVLFHGHCEICLDGTATHCHHVTYARFGREWLFDLACLCENCHADQHQHMQEQAL